MKVDGEIVLDLVVQLNQKVGIVIIGLKLEILETQL